MMLHTKYQDARPCGFRQEDFFMFSLYNIAPDKAAYCVFTQFRGPENAIKFISVRTKTQLKSLILNSELFRSVCRYSIQFAIVVFRITSCCWVQIYTRRGAKSS